MIKSLVTLATAAVLGLGSTVASADLLDFKVNETVVNGGGKNFTADKLNGGYTELLQADGMGGFSAYGFATFDGYRFNDGASAVAGEMTSYSIYAIFQASGLQTATGFQGTSGSIRLFVDRNFDTIGTLVNGFTVPTLTGTTDDDEIGYSLISKGVGTNPTASNPAGSFTLNFEEFTLTNFGKTYWYDPNPFYTFAISTGDLEGFAATNNPGEISIQGELSAAFVVPEPATLALMGLALAGAGAVSRRRKQA